MTAWPSLKEILYISGIARDYHETRFSCNDSKYLSILRLMVCSDFAA